MTFRFTLIDVLSGTEYGLDDEEPVNFDSKTSLQRDLNWMGMFFEFNVKQMEFTDEVAMGLLEQRYEEYGCLAQVNIRIDSGCEPGKKINTIYTGRINFNEYVKNCGDDYCSISVGVEKDGCLMQLKRNMDQKVDLETTSSFDGTPLQNYTALPFSGMLPPKAIKLTNEAKQTADHTDHLNDDPDFAIDSGTGLTNNLVVLPIDLNTFGEFGNFATLPTADYISGTTSALDESSAFYIHTDDNAIKCGGGVNIQVKGKWHMEITTSASYTTAPNLILAYRPGGVGGLTTLQLIAPTDEATAGFTHAYTWEIDTNDDVTPGVGDQFFLYVFFAFNKTTSGAVTVDLFSYKDTDLKMVQVSLCDPTPCKFFMVNEAFSRIVEAVTNDCLRVKSDFFGRTDSQPYKSEVDGCGALESITTGLLIRQIDVAKDTNAKPVFSVSMNDILDACNAIWCVGIGLETDQERQGSQVIRLEQGKYFFQEDVILDLGPVNLKKSAKYELMYNIFRVGYEKWEAEEFNGLDEFLTKREYRNNLEQASQALEKICKFIASGYAIEITRRKGNDTTQDWRFDSNTFIICMKRDEDGNLIVEQQNVTSASELLDPDTILNARISPARNAMHWAWILFQAYKKLSFPDAKLIFTSGEGNYATSFAITNDCKLEVGIVSEKGEINVASFANPETVIPIYNSERDEVTTGISEEEFKNVLQNPYGKVRYEYEGQEHFGWLEKMEYPINGEGDTVFVIIPEFNGI